MNDLKNHHQPASAAWMQAVLQALYASAGQPGPTREKPSSNFGARCHNAVLRAFDVLEMSRHRSELAAVIGPLPDHLRSLAQWAGVDLSRVLEVLRVKRIERPDSKSARGLARLARYLGLEKEEALLRLRLGFALASRTKAKADLHAVLEPSRARRTAAGSASLAATTSALRRCESDYGPRRQAELRRAEAAFSEVYG